MARMTATEIRERLIVAIDENKNAAANIRSSQPGGRLSGELLSAHLAALYVEDLLNEMLRGVA